MPRRTSRPSGGRRPAPRSPPARSASTRAAPSPPQRAPQRSQAPPPQKAGTKQAPPPAAAQPQQSGSGMGNFMSSVASTGLGVMAGRAMDRAFFGGGSGSAPVEDTPAEPAQGYESQPYAAGAGSSMPQEDLTPSICAREVFEFKKCMERSSSDIASCQWNLDILAACQQQQQQQSGFADASRL